MNSTTVNFIKKNKVGVLATLRKDGSPHAAVLHFVYDEPNNRFYFSTENTSRKCEALVDGGSTKAAMVIGFSEAEWITFQMNGDVRAILDPKELEKAQEVYYLVNPGSKRYKDDPSTIFLEFTTTWWRYSDYNKKPLLTISSED